MERSGEKKGKLLFVGAWCNPRTKRKLQAMALLSGRSQSAVLVDLIDAAQPVTESANWQALWKSKPEARLLQRNIHFACKVKPPAVSRQGARFAG